MIRKSLPILALAALMGGCSAMPPAHQIDYRCDNGYTLRVELDEQQARIHLHDRTLILPRRPDMQGERYVSDDRQQLFLRKGNQAVLAVSAGHGMLRCTEVP